MNYPTQTDVASEATTYNGWANYETWNISLYINNEYHLYKAACAYVSACIKTERPVSYKEFASNYSFDLTSKTPDGVSYMHPALDHKELDEMLNELVD